jgi:AcrR family transcriptional regulator
MAEEVKRYSPSGERVLAVATEVFYREGIRSTSMDSVVARSRVSKPTVYVQFRSKDELVAAVLRRRFEQRREALRQFLSDQPGPPAERLLAVFDWLARENAQFGALNRQWGVTLIDGGTQRLPRIVGYGNAMWLICTGCRIDAQRAFQIGLVQELVPEGQALPRALEIAHALAQLPQPALIADRRGVVASTGQALQAGLDFEARVGRAVMADPDVIERLTEYRKRHA